MERKTIDRMIRSGDATTMTTTKTKTRARTSLSLSVVCCLFSSPLAFGGFLTVHDWLNWMALGEGHERPEGRIRARVDASIARDDARDDARALETITIVPVHSFDRFKRVGIARGAAETVQRCVDLSS